MKTLRFLLPAALAAVFAASPWLRADIISDFRKTAGIDDAVSQFNSTVDKAGGYLDSASSSVKGVTTAGRLGAGYAEDYANVTSSTLVKGMSNLTYGQLNEVISGTFGQVVPDYPTTGPLTIVTSGGTMVLDKLEGVAMSAEKATTNSALIAGDGFMEGVEYTTYGANMTGQYLLAYTDPQQALKAINESIQAAGSELDELTTSGIDTMGQLCRPATVQAVLKAVGSSLTSMVDTNNSVVALSGIVERELFNKKLANGDLIKVTAMLQYGGYRGKTTDTSWQSEGAQVSGRLYTFDSLILAIELSYERKLGAAVQPELAVVGTIQGGMKFAGVDGVKLAVPNGGGISLLNPPQPTALGSVVIAGKARCKIDGAKSAPAEVEIEAQLAKIDLDLPLDPATWLPASTLDLYLRYGLAVAASAKFGDIRVKLDWSYFDSRKFVLADFSALSGARFGAGPELADAVGGEPGTGAGDTRVNNPVTGTVAADIYALTTNRGTFLERDANNRLVEGGPYLNVADVPQRARFAVGISSDRTKIILLDRSTNGNATGIGAAAGGLGIPGWSFNLKETADGILLIDPNTNLYAGYDKAAIGPLTGIAAPNLGVASENPCLLTLHQLKLGKLQPIAVQPRPQAPSRFEMGRVTPVQNDRNTWHSVAFSVPMRDPIVVMGPASYGGSLDGVAPVRVRNVTSEGFEYQVQEWSYLDGKWSGGSIGWMAVDRGPFQIRGLRGFAGSIRKLDHTSQSAILPQPFNVNPIVLAQVVTDNDPTPVCARISVTSNYQFSARLQEEEAADGVHGVEELDFIALAPADGTLDGARFSAFAASGVGGYGPMQALPAPFTHTPVVFGNLDSINDGDPALLRYVWADSQNLWLWPQEEQSRDTEIWHLGEVAGVLAVDLPTADARIALETDFVQDFETRGLAGWIVEGNAFSEKDITADLTNSQGVRFVQHDTYHLWGYKSGGNDQYGKLTSPAFTAPAAGGSFTFLFAGGNNPTLLRASLRRVSDDAEVCWTTGPDSDVYRRVTWDLTAYAGQQLYFVAIDGATGSGGHLSLDDLRVIEAGTSTTTPLGTINHGVARYDKRDGTGYVMYSVENLRTRFAGKWPLAGKTADHLVAIGWDATKKQWYFDDGDKGWYPFTPRADDRLLAVFRAANDKIKDLDDLEGQAFAYQGIQVGYDWGNFRFKRNLWDGGQNDGEIDILRPMPTGGYSFADYD